MATRTLLVVPGLFRSFHTAVRHPSRDDYGATQSKFSATVSHWKDCRGVALTVRTHNNHRSAVLPCTVCGQEAGDGAGWFLVAENNWLDSIKILRWHPTLAEQEAMHGVCCIEHVRTLLIHWLNFASLLFPTSPSLCRPTGGSMDAEKTGVKFNPALVGELAIHRESLSRTWSGSEQALDCILEALISSLTREIPQNLPPETRIATEAIALPNRAIDRALDYSLQAQPTGA